MIGVHDPVTAAKQQAEEAAERGLADDNIEKSPPGNDSARNRGRSGGRSRQSSFKEEGIARGADSAVLDQIEVGGMDEEEEPWWMSR